MKYLGSQSDLKDIATVKMGVPSGGTAGMVLSKATNSDYDVEWSPPSGGGGLVYTFENDTISPTPTKSAIVDALSSGQDVIVYIPAPSPFVPYDVKIYRFKSELADYNTVTFEAVHTDDYNNQSIMIMSFDWTGEMSGIEFRGRNEKKYEELLLITTVGYNPQTYQNIYGVDRTISEIGQALNNGDAISLHGKFYIAPQGGSISPFYAFIDTSDTEIVWGQNFTIDSVVWHGTAVDVTNGRLHCYDIELYHDNGLDQECLRCSSDTVFPLNYTAWNGGNY